MKYQNFIFDKYEFDPDSKQLTLHYSYDDLLQFREVYTFDFPFVDYDSAVLDRALQHLFVMAGVSYFKCFLAPNIQLNDVELPGDAAQFFSTTYQEGLGEFFYVNQLDPAMPILFPQTDMKPPVLTAQGNDGLLVGIGGGKDSLLSVELLRDSNQDVATWSLNHRSQLTRQVERIGLQHYWVERDWDPQLLELNNNGAYNGHVPISAIIACVGTVVAVLTGRRACIVSNEQSANEPTLQYRGKDINHQYSKSQAFESGYQQLLATNFGDSLQYYSLLRPLSELRIAELFSAKALAKYHDVFSSCNRAFTHTSDRLFWDGTCPKCAFVYLVLTPFATRDTLDEIFSGKNLLLDPALVPTYRQLLGIDGDKPLECVGEIKESRAAMQKALEIYPELRNTYTFDVPADYDYAQLAGHCLPNDIYQIVASTSNDTNR